MSRLLVIGVGGILLSVPAADAQRAVRFVQSAAEVEAYDFVEVTVGVEGPNAANPFADATVEGEFGPEGGPPVRVDGFCDSPDGSLYRIRFMPRQPGPHSYRITYRQGERDLRHVGTFTAVDGGRKGLVRVDPDHPWHFIWEGTGEHYFHNGTTAYFLAGWDEGTIRSNLDRLARLKVTRVRAALSGRVANGQAWSEHVYPTDRFSFLLNPWVAARSDSVENPGFDVTRFNVDYWRKWDALLRHARDLNVVISVIFYVDGARPGVDPFGKERMGGEDEQRYYRYAAARLGAFPNVMWDISNEYRFFRDDAWANRMGTFLRSCDPYDHLTSIHGFGDFTFRTAPWADFAMFQSWDEGGGYRFMLDRRREQAATGRPMPQVNEEYGYEDHYPTWGGNRKAPARSADNRRRLAWGMYMAGGYQTAGERADTGTGWGPDTGGGWINGRGDDSMVLFKGYEHIVNLFTSIPWWELEPDNTFVEAADQGPARPALTHLVYSRNAEGAAALYVNGERVAEGQVAGEVSNWDAGYRLALANELSRDRPWLGTYRRVVLYDRALSQDEVKRAFAAGPTGAPERPLVQYDFAEGTGDVVRDTSRDGERLDLTVTDPAGVVWLPGGGLEVRQPTLIASPSPASKLAEAVRRTGCLSVVVWVEPANATQAGPARIVTLSRDPSARNFTLGQDQSAYLMRFRTTATSQNAEPPISTPGASSSPSVMALRSPAHDLAVLYLPAGATVRIHEGSLREGLKLRWFNPRTGEWSDVAPPQDGSFVAPDRNDWVLLGGL